MWYLIVFGLIGLTLYCFRKKRIAARFPEEIGSGLEARLANDATVIFGATLVLAAVAAMILGSAPAGKVYRDQQLARDRQYRQAMAEILARKLAAQAKGGEHALVLLPPALPADQEALLAGLKAGFGGKIEIAKTIALGDAPALSPEAAADPRARSRALELRTPDLERELAEAPDCRVLVSFAGLPGDYAGSPAAARASQGQLLVGTYTDNVFMLGYALSQKAVTACVLPKPLDSPLQTPGVPADPQAAFDQRFDCLDAANVVDYARLNKRLFRLTKAF